MRLEFINKKKIVDFCSANSELGRTEHAKKKIVVESKLIIFFYKILIIHFNTSRIMTRNWAMFAVFLIENSISVAHAQPSIRVTPIT